MRSLYGSSDREPALVTRARHKQHLHAEGTQLMSAAAMRRVFDTVYGTLGWRGSLADRMVDLVRRSGSGRYSSGRFDHIQEGFGRLMV